MLSEQTNKVFDTAKLAQKARRYDEAWRGLQSVIQKHPYHLESLLSLGAIALDLGKEAVAKSYFRQAAAAAPQDFRPLHNLACLALQSSKPDEARRYAEAAARVAPNNAAAHHALASVLISLGLSREGLRQVERASHLAPSDIGLFLQMVLLKRQVCDWRNFEADEDRIREFAAKGFLVPPFALLSTEATKAEQQVCAIRWARSLEKQQSEQFLPRKPSSGRPLRVGYVSGDFHDHATSRLVAELFENHDRTRVKVYGYSYGPEKPSAMRQRIIRSFDVFRDVRNVSSKAIAERIYEDEIDILVDLKGYTSRARTNIFAWRPAAIQVNYLGFPGTMGASFIDYVITDRAVSPPEYEAYSTEKFAYLPHCFQPNDTHRPIPDGSVSRTRYGISDSTFVYCCFNAAYKLTPKVFDVWMRILQAVPESVLCLLARSQEQVAHLKREANERGVDPKRLVFAPTAKMDEHLARCALADLFLDTLPVSAFTTASDALWAGLPILTCAGLTPAGRGSTSLLQAAGVPELVTENLLDYETMAIRLARDPTELLILRERIKTARKGLPPFDTKNLVTDLESLFYEMSRLGA